MQTYRAGARHCDKRANRILQLGRRLRSGSPIDRPHNLGTDDDSIGLSVDCAAAAAIHPVEISPLEIVDRHTTKWPGMAAQVVQFATHDKVELSFRAPVHLLAAYEQGVRRDGETFIEGLPRSMLRDVARKLSFAPAGHEYYEWHEPRTLTRLMYVYLDPAELQTNYDLYAADTSFVPRVFFEDPTLWSTVLKLLKLVESQPSANRLYVEALGVVLVHELMRFNRGTSRVDPPMRGGLAPWQQRTVIAYVEEHLAEQISLAALAQLARLSPYYFCRAFKQSFGVPPHRYHIDRRIERARSS